MNTLLLENIPSVSVLMAVYNTPSSYLELAINSVLRQTFSDFEFIIVDDASDQHTRKLLIEMAGLDRRIRLICLERNLGLTKALNIGLKSIRSQYVARQDADDVSMPDRLAITIRFMQEHPNFAGVGTFIRIIGSSGDNLSMPCTQPDITKIEKRNTLIHGSMIFRMASINRIGGYNERLRFSQDYELYLRMTRVHGMQLTVVPIVLYALRKHMNSISSRSIYRQFYCSVLAKYLTLPRRSFGAQSFGFIKIYSMDFFFTHRLLLGPIFRKFITYLFLSRK
jgi:glycosyltransferase involved in cell wall biosynthesis